MLNKLAYYAKWYYLCRIRNRKIPLNSSLILTDQCNLKCKHCTVSGLGYPARSFREVTGDVRKLYDLGSRVLVITGGEPYVWADKEYTVEDIVRFAKTVGFFRVVICTNGTYDLRSSADYLWVSLDGFSLQHTNLRGDVYERVVRNIEQSRHGSIYINFTISRENHDIFEEAAEEILKIRNIRGILFHIFTPYKGSDPDLKLTAEEKDRVLGRLLKIKRKHPVRIFNTFDGLRAMRSKDWDRPIWASIVSNRGQIGPCCCREGIYDKEICEECGCTPAVETYVLQEGKVLAGMENLRFI